MTPSRINEAHSVIQALCDELTHDIRSKGYSDFHAEIWVGRETDRVYIHFTTNGKGTSSPRSLWTDTAKHLPEIFNEAKDKVANLKPLPTSADYAPWFTETSHGK